MRDPHLDRALSAAARRGRAGGACPDAAMLAAYADGSLTAAERSDLETHAADCPTCVEMLAVLASLESDEHAQSQWFRFASPWTRWRWLIPVATAVLVVAVWIRAERPGDIALPGAAAPTPASSVTGLTSTRNQPVDSPAALEPDAKVLESARQKATATAGRRDERLTPLRAAAPVAAPSGGAATGMLEDRDAKKERAEMAKDLAAQESAQLDSNTVAQSSPAPMPAPAQAPGAPRADGAPAAVTGDKTDALGRLNERAAGGAAKAARSSSAMLLKQAPASFVIEVPGTVVRIRVDNDRIERSLDGGTTWAVEWPGPVSMMRNGTCPTVEVCWLGGDAGAILVREADGRWQARGIPDIAATVSAFTAVSATAATATLADGRRFSTSDAGVHWQAIP